MFLKTEPKSKHKQSSPNLSFASRHQVISSHTLLPFSYVYTSFDIPRNRNKLRYPLVSRIGLYNPLYSGSPSMEWKTCVQLEVRRRITFSWILVIPLPPKMAGSEGMSFSCLIPLKWKIIHLNLQYTLNIMCYPVQPNPRDQMKVLKLKLYCKAKYPIYSTVGSFVILKKSIHLSCKSL